MRLPPLPKEGEAVLDIDFDDFRFTQLKKTYHATAGFAELEFKPFEPSLLVPGVRLDHFTGIDELAVQYDPALLVALRYR